MLSLGIILVCSALCISAQYTLVFALGAGVNVSHPTLMAEFSRSPTGLSQLLSKTVGQSIS